MTEKILIVRQKNRVLYARTVIPDPNPGQWLNDAKLEPDEVDELFQGAQEFNNLEDFILEYGFAKRWKAFFKFNHDFEDRCGIWERFSIKADGPVTKEAGRKKFKFINPPEVTQIPTVEDPLPVYDEITGINIVYSQSPMFDQAMIMAIRDQLRGEGDGDNQLRFIALGNQIFKVIGEWCIYIQFEHKPVCTCPDLELELLSGAHFWVCRQCGHTSSALMADQKQPATVDF